MASFLSCVESRLKKNDRNVKGGLLGGGPEGEVRIKW
jgi:hypothetical protein